MSLSPLALLTAPQMAELDQVAIRHGMSGISLMERAGLAVAEAIQRRFSLQETLVLAGPGNNGGDGWIVAETLRQAGWPIRVAYMGERQNLKGDAHIAAARYQGACEHLSHGVLEGLTRPTLVVDALFGTGISRPIAGEVHAVIEQINERKIPVVAVDIPSGVDASRGDVPGIAPVTALTVTFHRKKLGHALYPGRAYCGEIEVVDIGIPDYLEPIGAVALENHPDVWLPHWHWPTYESHKYSRGHVLVQGGGVTSTGAARLAARAALRAAAGLVTVMCDEASLPIYAGALESEMVRLVPSIKEFKQLLDDVRMQVLLMGPGAGVGDATRERVLAGLAAGKSMVLDADALTSFVDQPNALFEAIQQPVILTPHLGEFARLFPDIHPARLKTVRAVQAAGVANAVVILKGADTIIAAPDGRFAVNTHASAFLATAGSGDVLAGIAAALMASGMSAWEAACAAVWLHGMAGAEFGAGLTASDLPDLLPEILHHLRYRMRV